MSRSNHQFQKSLGERTKDFQVLRQTVEAVSSTMDVQMVLQQIVERVWEVTGADACLLYLLDETSRALVLRVSKPPHPERVGRIALRLGEGLTGWVAKERRVVAIGRRAFEDARFNTVHQLPEDRYEAFLSAPVTARDRLVGVINVQHRQPRRYSADTVALVETIGGLVGGAIANARLYQDVRRRQRELEMLAQVSEAVVSARYLDEILQLIVTVTAELMGSKICSLMLLDEDERVLVIKATQALSPAYRDKPPIKVGQSISGRVVQARQPIAVRDVTREKGYMYPELAAREGLRSLLSVPMMIKDRVIGVLNSYTALERRFSDEEIRLLSTVASQAAVAIEHTRLLERAVALQKSLEERKVVEQAKGILMRELRLSEAEAFRRLRKQSMEKRKTMRDIAEAVLLAEEFRKSS